MTLGGWITFLISVSIVTILFVWCIWRVLSCKKPSKMQGADLFEDIENESEFLTKKDIKKP